jgi:hypothetical protein
MRCGVRIGRQPLEPREAVVPERAREHLVVERPAAGRRAVVGVRGPVDRRDTRPALRTRDQGDACGIGHRSVGRDGATALRCTPHRPVATSLAAADTGADRDLQRELRHPYWRSGRSGSHPRYVHQVQPSLTSPAAHGEQAVTASTRIHESPLGVPERVWPRAPTLSKRGVVRTQIPGPRPRCCSSIIRPPSAERADAERRADAQQCARKGGTPVRPPHRVHHEWRDGANGPVRPQMLALHPGASVIDWTPFAQRDNGPGVRRRGRSHRTWPAHNGGGHDRLLPRAPRHHPETPQVRGVSRGRRVRRVEPPHQGRDGDAHGPARHAHVGTRARGRRSGRSCRAPPPCGTPTRRAPSVESSSRTSPTSAVCCSIRAAGALGGAAPPAMRIGGCGSRIQKRYAA